MAVLAIHGYEHSSNCGSGGFRTCSCLELACTSQHPFWGGVVSSTSHIWRAYNGRPPANWGETGYDDSGWSAPLSSTAGGYCYPTCGKASNGATPSKIWLSARDVAFRVLDRSR